MKTSQNRTRLLGAAIAAILPMASHAVHLNPHGTGQVLIYPYYTVRGASTGNTFNTPFSIVNGGAQTKALKVRALEARAGAQVMDFNLYLPPNDTWTAVIVPTATGSRIITNDNSCVMPSDLFTTAGKNDFYNRQYLNDTGPAELDRTREGYIEVIEMGVVTDPTALSYIRHNPAGVPANCAALIGFDTAITAPNSFPASLSAPTGGLYGRGIVLNAASGASYGYDAVALDAWSATVQFTLTGSIEPLLGRANPPVSRVMTSEGMLTATWQNGTDAVSAALMRSEISNEYVLDAVTSSKTDWIVMFPTKREYVRVGDGAASPPFTSNFSFPSNGGCDPFNLASYTRESGTIGAPPSTPITLLPRPSTVIQSPLCWSVSVLPLASTGSHLSSITVAPGLSQIILAFANASTTSAGTATSVPGTVQGPNGVLRLSLENALVQGLTPISSTLNGAPTTTPKRHFGLPLISLSFTNFNNRGVTSQYGIVTPAKYQINIR